MSGRRYVWVVYYGQSSVYDYEKVFTNKIHALNFKYQMWNKGWAAKIEKRFD